jgi:taurine dehydrogenase small subunit
VSAPEPVGIVREMFDAWNAHDVVGYAGRLHSACTVEWTTGRPVAGGDLVGRETACWTMQKWLVVFPDINFRVKAIIAAGDRLVASWVATATHTGRALETPGCSVVDFQRGQIVRVWSYWDDDTMLRHLQASTAQE